MPFACFLFFKTRYCPRQNPEIKICQRVLSPDIAIQLMVAAIRWLVLNRHEWISSALEALFISFHALDHGSDSRSQRATAVLDTAASALMAIADVCKISLPCCYTISIVAASALETILTGADAWDGC